MLFTKEAHAGDPVVSQRCNFMPPASTEIAQQFDVLYIFY